MRQFEHTELTEEKMRMREIDVYMRVHPVPFKADEIPKEFHKRFLNMTDNEVEMILKL